MIRLTIPSIEEDDLQAVRAVLETGYLVQGPRVAEFEQMIAAYTGSPFAVAVSNGTAALHLALLALGVERDDVVLVTAYSWPATANVIELVGARPVFVDIDPDTFNMAPERLEEALQTHHGERIKAILPIHAFGQMADMAAISTLAERYHIPVIEDAACALGASLQGHQAGRWGRMGCFSLHPRKAITTGEGGFITTDDPALVRTLRALRNHGLDPDAPGADFIMPGYNYRMTEFQAALGYTQMSKLDRVISARRRLAAHYDELFMNTPIQTPIVGSKDSFHIYQSYVTLLPEDVALRRAEIIKALLDKGIQSNIGTYHMPLITYYRTRYGYKAGDFPAADAVFARSLTLPLHEQLTADEQDTVVHSVVELAR